MLRQLQVVMGQPILPLLIHSHLPHYQLVCLAELQCQYLPPWSYHMTHSVLVVTAELHQFDIGVRVSPLQAAPDSDQSKFSLITSVLLYI